MAEAIVISDLHLGSDNCEAKSLLGLLDEIRRGQRPADKLIINGDFFDSFDFRRLNKHHWRVLSRLRKMSDILDIIWINGNHDGPAEIVSHLLGVNVVDEYVLDSGGRKILLLHGHQFDRFIIDYPITTRLADFGYRLLQKLDRTHAIARTAKRSSKIFLRCLQQIEDRSIQHARRRGCDAVCCGHTHHAMHSSQEGIQYFNSGCWTEKPCHFLVIDDGCVSVESYANSLAIEEPDYVMA